MIDALNLAGPASLELIHLDEPRELAYWAHVLGVSEDELRKIVNSVGPRAIDVRHHLARERRAEWQRKAHQHQASQHVHQPVHRAPKGDPGFALLLYCGAAVATTFGALAYNLTPADEWSTFQRQHGCEAAANVDPTVERLRCPDGRTIVRTKFAGAADSAATKPMPMR